jgi:hypothetical protein
VKPVTVVGDVLPGGGTVAAPPSALALSRDGRHAAFVLPVLEGDGEREALVVTTDGVARVIARAGDPTAAGGTLAAFGEVASVSIADTTIVYAGTLNGAGAAFGLFVCPNLSCD